MTDKSQMQQVMPAGGQVTAVVPQTVEEIFRVSKGIVQSGLAPYALTGKTGTTEEINKAISAVAVTIMAGAELGLPPMVALRSFTVINGRPALYGDGLINVVRRSKMAKRIDVGFAPGKDEELGDDARGYCEAERADTGEKKRVEFSVRQAKRAGLWQTDPIIKNKEVWEYDQAAGKRKPTRKDVPNDSPWYRYPERMLGWRAAGFCLRELFGDVLGGITDDWEAREITGEVRDITPPSRPTPPPEPEDETVAQTPAPPAEAASEAPTPPRDAEMAAGIIHEPGTDGWDFDMDELRTALAGAHTEDEVTDAWDEFQVEIRLFDDTPQLNKAFALKRDAMDRVSRPTEADGQGDMLGEK